MIRGMSMPERLFHAAPLHYLPSIVSDGALYAHSVLAPRGIRPRATAFRRDRMLGLQDFVHLSCRPDTPLLAHKLTRGYPHALLVFDAAAVLALPQVALLPANAKSWRSRAALSPVTEPDEQAGLWRRAMAGRLPSLEVLVKYGLSLELCLRIDFLTASECALAGETLAAVNRSPVVPLRTEPTTFPLCRHYAPATVDQIQDYFAACCAAGAVLPPPHIPFD